MPTPLSPRLPRSSSSRGISTTLKIWTLLGSCFCLGTLFLQASVEGPQAAFFIPVPVKGAAVPPAFQLVSYQDKETKQASSTPAPQSDQAAPITGSQSEEEGPDVDPEDLGPDLEEEGNDMDSEEVRAKHEQAETPVKTEKSSSLKASVAPISCFQGADGLWKTSRPLKIFTYGPILEQVLTVQTAKRRCDRGMFASQVLIPDYYARAYEHRVASPADADLVVFAVYPKCESAKRQQALKLKRASHTARVLRTTLEQYERDAGAGRATRAAGRDRVFVVPSGGGTGVLGKSSRLVRESILLMAEGSNLSMDRPSCPTCPKRITRFNATTSMTVPGFYSYSRLFDELLPTHLRRLTAVFCGSFRRSPQRVAVGRLAAYYNATSAGQPHPSASATPRSEQPSGPEAAPTPTQNEARDRAPAPTVMEARADGKSKAQRSLHADVVIAGKCDLPTLVAESKFCLVPVGWTPWTVRLYEAVLSGCIPVLFGDKFVLPFPHLVPWSEFVVRWPEDNISPALIDHLRAIPDHQLRRMWTAVTTHRPALAYYTGARTSAFDGVNTYLQDKFCTWTLPALSTPTATRNSTSTATTSTPTLTTSASEETPTRPSFHSASFGRDGV